ncbi:glutathione S-transferase family protein [Rhodophyticola sp.]|jgi:glutathione S-transferase|uniref:glutathione S-transferase family protein n=1 Tax=Rhodophyticola sp. TaxID=2680032 RepID=UPI001B216433|nr:glutathione S-transferase family protein [Roseicyclus sp.]MBO6623370.1 glutathione S-transferase family protein [Roseicyclus sp.]MBO6920706.1 glutathione S-transferase family protein [Roseicyclus sp.]
MYQVIGGVKSRALRVLWTLEEIGLDYEHVSAPPRSDAVISFNPAGKIPVLVSGGVPITDSVAIMTYLADKHGALTFPAGTIERARQDSLTQFIVDEFDQLLWTAARHSFVLPEDKRVPEIKDSLKWEFERSQKALIPRMAEDGPFLMGDTMTIADILLAHCGGWAVAAKFPIVEPQFRDFVTMMRERPAFQRAMAA